MKILILTKGKFTIVDDDIYELVKHHKWSASYKPTTDSYYVQRSFVHYDGSKKIGTILLHRYIMELDKNDGKQVDHINNDSLDNRRCNLRLTNYRDNQHNSWAKKNGYSTSKYAGVCWHSRDKKWYARISIDGKSHSLGYYTKEEAARNAYKDALESFLSS